MLHQNTVKLNEITKKIVDYCQEEPRKLVYHLYQKGYTVREVADILGVTPAAVSLKYPKKEGELFK